jgi:hypothetical protein
MQTQVPDPVEFNKRLEQAFADFKDGYFDAAEPVLRDALAPLANDGETLAKCLEKLIEISSARGQSADAIRQSLRLLSLLKARLGEFDVTVMIRMHKLAGLYETVGRLDEADYLHKRVATLKTQLVRAKLTDEQKAIHAEKNETGKKEEKKDLDLGPEPEWLARAFEDANRLYGSGKPKSGPDAVAIFVPEQAPTGHYFRPIKLEPQEVAQLRDLTDFGKHVNEPGPPAHQPSPNPSSRPPAADSKPQQNSTSSIVPRQLKDEVTYIQEDTSSARLKRIEASQIPTPEINWSLRSPSGEKRLNSNPLPEFRGEEPQENRHDHVSRDDLRLPKPLKTAVYKAKPDKKDKTAGRPSELPAAQGEDIHTTFKDIVWRVGKVFKAFSKNKVQYGTTRDIVSGADSNPDSSHLTRNVPTKRVIRKSLEFSGQTGEQPLILRETIHQIISTFDKLKQKDNLLRAILSTFIIGFGLLLVADKFIPRKITAQEVFAEMPVAYRAASGDMQLRMIDPASAQLTVGETNLRVPCSMFLGDWRDCLTISFSALLQKQQWFLRTDQGLKGTEGPIFYFLGGPELQIADQMENLAELAASLYSATSSYPLTAADFPRGRIAYQNPFSKETVRPIVERLYFDTDQDPRARALTEGTTLAGEANITPGTIKCYSLTIQKAGQIEQMFFVRGYDRFGAQLAGNTPGTTYVLALKDGHWLHKETPQPAFLRWSPRKRTFWLIDNSTDAFTLVVLSQGGAYFFAAMCVLLVLLKKAVKPVKATERIMNFLIPASAALSFLYAFARILP